MLKQFGVAVVVITMANLAGCFTQSNAQLSTQAQGEVSLTADQYSIQVTFAAQGKTSEAALAKLNGASLGFIKWKDESGFNVATQNESVQPMYQYPKNGPRQLSGYQAQHSYRVKELDLNQYAQAMSDLAAFQPESLYQGEVGVSEDIRQAAMAQAYALAYAANARKLDTMLALANLCSPTVASMSESSQSHGAPRAMMMEAKSAPVANEHTISVRLDITWQASGC